MERLGGARPILAIEKVLRGLILGKLLRFALGDGPSALPARRSALVQGSDYHCCPQVYWRKIASLPSFPNGGSQAVSVLLNVTLLPPEASRRRSCEAANRQQQIGGTDDRHHSRPEREAASHLMLLFDLRLKFARDLIGHWLEIRRGALVPLEVDLDPRAILRRLSQIGIIDLTQPSKLVIEQAGAGLRRRFGREIRHMNWVELVPPLLGDAGARAREQIRRVPCGFYHKFTVEYRATDQVTAETLLLPLRRRNVLLPHAAIGITRECGRKSARTPDGWLTPTAPIADYRLEFVELRV